MRNSGKMISHPTLSVDHRHCPTNINRILEAVAGTTWKLPASQTTSIVDTKDEAKPPPPYNASLRRSAVARMSVDGSRIMESSIGPGIDHAVVGHTAAQMDEHEAHPE